MKMDFLLYEPEDFILDESYLRYYFKESHQDVIFWENWIQNNPQKSEVVQQADKLIALLALQLPDQEYQGEFNRMMSAIHLLASANTANTLNKSKVDYKKIHQQKIYKIAKYVTAACVVLALVFYWVFPAKVDYLSDEDIFNNVVVNKVKASDKPQSLTLADGTVVKLSPGATLTYPIPFKGDKREVYLSGEAYFDVSSNPSRPFYVYSRNLVTHVLGTSFIVKANESNNKIEVEVIAGKVEVCENETAKQHVKVENKSAGVILTPNQKVVYSVTDCNFETGLVVDPKIVVPHVDTLKEEKNQQAELAIAEDIFVFNAIALSSIINDLKTAYNIDIEVENSNILNCHFSGNISKMNLYRKLDVICKSLGYSYEIKGTKILIRGSGCL